MQAQEITPKAGNWMLNRGWKRLTAKRREFEQSLFEHTMVELDALTKGMEITLHGIAEKRLYKMHFSEIL